MLRTQLRRRSLFAAAAAAGIVTDNVSSGSSPRVKLSIYPEPEPQIVLVDTPSLLERRIGTVRETITAQYNDAHAYVQGWVSRWIGVEHAVERRLKSFKHPSESLTPSLLYVGVAALTGSVLARSRGLPTRILLPPTLTLIAFSHFLPNTASNVGSYITDLERRYVPRAAEIQETAIAHSKMTWEMAREKAADGKETVEDGVRKAVGTVQEKTGLKLRETLGWGREEVKGVEAFVEKKVEEGKEKVGEVVEQVGKKVEEGKEKVGEVVEQVGKKVEEGKEKVGEVVEQVGKKVGEGKEKVGEVVEQVKKMV